MPYLCHVATALDAFLQVKAVGKDRLVLDLSCKKHNGAYHVATDRWQKISSVAVNQQSLSKLGNSCAEFLVHGVDVEGKQSGMDEELVELLAEQSPVPVTYAGGVSSMVRCLAGCLEICTGYSSTTRVVVDRMSIAVDWQARLGV